jgi:hypothetical protein
MNSLRRAWVDSWPKALNVWSPYVKLSEPIWCNSADEEKHEGLTGSFAMIRLVDHRVVISLRQVEEEHLENFAIEILAHEIGHHVYCPADLTDNARMIARLQKGLPGKEHHAPMIGNLYADLLINDRLQRSAGLSMAAVYQQLGIANPGRLWLLYMRTYELLWRLPSQTLARGNVDARIHSDAQLATRLIRNYAKDWVDGAGRFAALYLPYLMEDDGKRAGKAQARWNDTRDAGKGGLPSGLTSVEEDEETGAIHPAFDPDVNGVSPTDEAAPSQKAGQTGHKAMKDFRSPVEYADVLKAASANLPEEIVLARYYKELAVPHLIRFPVREAAQATDPSPEGLDTWDTGGQLENIDWMGTLSVSPIVIPGVTTRERLYGSAPGSSPESMPLGLYLGVDCSGSMGNPARALSYPILAAAIIALSALRAGANVMVALSGEPGKTVTTAGFIRDETKILTTLTGYLGTGFTFGIHRLQDIPPNRRPVHIVIITDNDIFRMLDRQVDSKSGWDVARTAVLAARGGATYVLQLPAYLMAQEQAKRTIPAAEQRMLQDGWHVAHVDSMNQLLVFAREFSQAKYHKNLEKGAHGN